MCTGHVYTLYTVNVPGLEDEVDNIVITHVSVTLLHCDPNPIIVQLGIAY
jgi:hypothetical protein